MTITTLNMNAYIREHDLLDIVRRTKKVPGWRELVAREKWAFRKRYPPSRRFNLEGFRLDSDETEWMDDHSPGWTAIEHSTSTLIGFENPDDAFAFKLRWL
jgi:hypothetical protein